MIRKAEPGDVPAIAALYDRIHDAEEAGTLTIGWARGVYPTEATARAALGRGDMFVLEEAGRISAAAIINRTEVDCYREGSWLYPAGEGEVMVLHTLVVDPESMHRGLGRDMIAFYEAYALQNGCRVLRMDTNARNRRARALYARLGYRESGAVPCVFNGIEGVMLVLLEKKL